MTITRGSDATAAPERARRSHVPGDGIGHGGRRRARPARMLHDVTPRKRTASVRTSCARRSSARASTSCSATRAA